MEIPEFATDDGVERVLVVVAHPDDIDFGTAGSVATWTDAGIEVTYCLVTSGEAGGDDRTMPRADMARIRRGGADRRPRSRSASPTSASSATPTAGVEPTLELRRDISRVIRQVRPQRVVSMSPERIWERVYASHPDHLATGEATIAAVYPDSRNPFAHPELLDEGLEPWTVPAAVDRSSAATSNVYVDTTDAFDRKLAALLSHESQIPDPAWAETIAARLGRRERRGRRAPRRPPAPSSSTPSTPPDPLTRRRSERRSSGDEAEARDRGEAVVGAASSVAPESDDCHTSPAAVPNAAWSPKPSSAAVSMLPSIQSVTRSNGVSPWIDVR